MALLFFVTALFGVTAARHEPPGVSTATSAPSRLIESSTAKPSAPKLEHAPQITTFNVELRDATTSHNLLTNGITCGYFEGSWQSPVTCPYTASCTYYTDLSPPNFGCGDVISPTSIYMSTCIDFGEGTNSAMGAVFLDWPTFNCYSERPYCTTVVLYPTFDGTTPTLSISSYGCQTGSRAIYTAYQTTFADGVYPTSSSTSSFSSSSTSVASSSAPASATASSTGLSTGAEAGIGVGVSVAVIAMIAVGVLWFWRRRRATRNAPTLQRVDDGHQKFGQDSNRFSDQRPPMYHDQNTGAYQPKSAYGSDRLKHSELSGVAATHELEGNNAPMEMAPIRR